MKCTFFSRTLLGDPPPLWSPHCRHCAKTCHYDIKSNSGRAFNQITVMPKPAVKSLASVAKRVREAAEGCGRLRRRLRVEIIIIIIIRFLFASCFQKAWGPDKCYLASNCFVTVYRPIFLRTIQFNSKRQIYKRGSTNTQYASWVKFNWIIILLVCNGFSNSSGFFFLSKRDI